MLGGRTLRPGENRRQCQCQCLLVSRMRIHQWTLSLADDERQLRMRWVDGGASTFSSSPFSHSPRRLHCQSEGFVLRTKNIVLSCSRWWCISLREIHEKRGFVLPTFLEPSGSTPIVNRFSARAVAKGSCKQTTPTDRPDDLRKATSRPGDLALFGFSLDVLAAAATAWNFSSITTLSFLSSGLASLCIKLSDPTLFRPSFRLSWTPTASPRPENRGAVHNGHSDADVSPFPPFTFTEFTFASSERK